jgi:hypothetical protein
MVEIAPELNRDSRAARARDQTGKQNPDMSDGNVAHIGSMEAGVDPGQPPALLKVVIALT